jgi:gliding motility-associated-like protein
MIKKYTLAFLMFFCLSVSVFAQYADVGAGVLKNHVWWFDWNGFTVTNGASRTFTTADGVVVKFVFSGVSGFTPVPTVMSTWRGAVLRFLYDFTDPAIKPALFCENTNQNTYFTMTVTATRDGLPIPFTFLAADAEGSDRNVEHTTFSTTAGNWSILEFFRNSAQSSNPVTGCGTSTVVIADTQGNLNGDPIGQNPLMATDVSSSGTVQIGVKMEKTTPGGMAVAFGIYAPIDRGDLPESYGYVRHQLKYTRNNGCNFNPPYPSISQDVSLTLGNTPPDADYADNIDDNLVGVDEDAFTTFPAYTGNGTYSLDVPVTNTTGADAWLTGYFDYNRNGTFDVNEAATVVVPANATRATLIWGGLPARFSAGSVSLFGFRFRLSSSRSATQSVFITAEDGEVEDYLVTLDAPCAITTNLTNTTVCAGASVQLEATGGTTYNWSPAIGLSATNIASPVATPDITTTYTVAVADAGGCGGTADVTIVVNPVPDIATGVNVTICPGDSAPLYAVSATGTTFSWTPATGLNDATILSPVATPAVTTTYTVTAGNNTGCTSQATVLVTVRSLAEMTVSPANPAVCEGENAMLTATGGDRYEWREDGQLLSETGGMLFISPARAANYAVTINNTTCGITRTFVVPMTIHSNPVTGISRSNDIDCSHGQAALLATGGVQYVWDDAAGISNTQIANPVVSPRETTTYAVTITDANGCVGQEEITVPVDFATALSVYPMPSAFTPNGDGKNDCFGLKYWGAVTALEFNIYNRWGVLVFSTRDTGTCWDGRYKGELQPSGGYVYSVRAKTVCGDVERKGVVTLIR